MRLALLLARNLRGGRTRVRVPISHALVLAHHAAVVSAVVLGKEVEKWIGAARRAADVADATAVRARVVLVGECAIARLVPRQTVVAVRNVAAPKRFAAAHFVHFALARRLARLAVARATDALRFTGRQRAWQGGGAARAQHDVER